MTRERHRRRGQERADLVAGRPYGDAGPPASRLHQALGGLALLLPLALLVRGVALWLARLATLALPAAVHDPLVYCPLLFCLVGLVVVVILVPKGWRRRALGMALAVFLVNAAGEYRWASAVPPTAFPVPPAAVEASLGTAADSPRGPLRLLSYNIHYKAVPDGQLVDFILAVGADIVTLQEVPGWWYRKHQPRLQETYPTLVYTSTLRLLTASRLPTKTAAWQETTGTGWRGCLAVELQTPAGPLTVYNAHLWTPSTNPRYFPVTLRLQWEQAEQLGKLLADAPGPLVLIGDFNFPSWSWSHTRLRQLVPDLVEGVPPGLSYSFPSVLPMIRIDQMVGRQVRFHAVQIGSSTLSDHLPLTGQVDLSVP